MEKQYTGLWQWPQSANHKEHGIFHLIVPQMSTTRDPDNSAAKLDRTEMQNVFWTADMNRSHNPFASHFTHFAYFRVLEMGKVCFSTRNAHEMRARRYFKAPVTKLSMLSTPLRA